MALKLVEPRVDLSVVELARSFTDRLEQQGLWVKFGIDSEDIEDDTRGRPVVAATDDVAVADDKDQLSLVVIVEGGKRVDGPSERFFAFGITRHLAEYKLVLKLGRSLAGQLERSQDYDPTNESAGNDSDGSIWHSHLATTVLIMTIENASSSQFCTVHLASFRKSVSPR